MSPHELAVVLKRFEEPDEVRSMEKGRFELVRVGGLSIGRATYEPGWRWEKHVGLVLAGTCAVGFADGREVLLKPGSLFHVPAEPHDSWVVGDGPYVSLHFLGADKYAR